MAHDPTFTARVTPRAGGAEIAIAHGPAVRTYALEDFGHAAYRTLFAAIFDGHGWLLAARPADWPAPAADDPLQPLLSEAASPAILYGYGDPSVIRVEAPGGRFSWRLLVTSNDAPDAFPILRSDDMVDWSHCGFVFPQGEAPPWTLPGEAGGDFWAPEMHRVNGEYWVCFSAREHSGALAIGLARASSPDGPFIAGDRPILGGGVIDPHILTGPGGAPYLVWKLDDNAVWPRRLADRLRQHPGELAQLFPAAADQGRMALVLALWPWGRTRPPMEQFFVLQPLIETAADDLEAFDARLAGLAPADPEIAAIRRTLRTRIFAQPLSPDGSALTGAPVLVLQNDQPWEAHLIEGVWSAEAGGRYYLFYAGNDFSTPHYGIGAAVAHAPLGPYAKLPDPLLRSTDRWWGPGHPSIAPGPDGRPRMFLHAFRPGEVGYKAFRALLSAAVEFDGDAIRLRRP